MDLVTTWGVCGFTASTACSELHKILFPVLVAPSQGFPNIPEVAQETEELSVCPSLIQQELDGVVEMQPGLLLGVTRDNHQRGAGIY